MERRVDAHDTIWSVTFMGDFANGNVRTAHWAALHHVESGGPLG
jgi:hypothetical protein